MSIFLAVKQITDVLYRFKILDYFLVFLAFAMMSYAFFRNKSYKHFFSKINIADIIAALLCVLYFFSFIRNPEAKGQFIKSESAFFVYFFGRILGINFYNEITSMKEEDGFKGKILPFVSYIIVYANLAFKLYIQISYIVTGRYMGSNPEFDIHSDGALYYYKTDMTLGIIMAVIFIYAFSKKKILKWITIVPVGLFMVFYQTTARSGQAILILEYMLIGYMELKKRDRIPSFAKKIKISVNCVGVVIMIAITAFFVFIQVFPPMRMNLEDIGVPEDIMSKIENIFHSRHLIWWDAISYYVGRPLSTRLIGIDMISENMHNPLGDRFHNLYFKLIYAVGYMGTYLFWGFVICLMKTMKKNVPGDITETMERAEESDDKTLSVNKKTLAVIKYMTAAFWIMFMFIGISMEGMDYTQMTWYPFILFGVLVTVTNKKHSDTKA